MAALPAPPTPGHSPPRVDAARGPFPPAMALNSSRAVEHTLPGRSSTLDSSSPSTPVIHRARSLSQLEPSHSSAAPSTTPSVLYHSLTHSALLPHPPPPPNPAAYPSRRTPNPVPLLTPELELELGTATGLGRCTCATASADEVAGTPGIGAASQEGETSSNGMRRACAVCVSHRKVQAPPTADCTGDAAGNSDTASSAPCLLTPLAAAVAAAHTTPALSSASMYSSPSSQTNIMPPYRHPPPSVRRPQPTTTPTPITTAPLLLRRRSRALPLFPREDDGPALALPGIPTLTGIGGYTGPAPGFTFVTCPSVPDSDSDTPLLSPDLGVSSPSPAYSFGSPFGFARSATPTTELGAFEYPASLNERKGSTASTSSYTSHASHSSVISASNLPLHSPVKVAPPLPLKSSPASGQVATMPQPANVDRYGYISLPQPRSTEPQSAAVLSSHTAPLFPFDSPALGRRGSIALGQIPRLARAVPGRPRGHTSSSSINLTGGGSTYAALVGTSPGPYGLPLPHPEAISAPRSSSAGNMSQNHTRTPGATPRGSPALAPVGSASPLTGPVYLLPRNSVLGGPIAFAHSALPAPIPPSLLARRGSVPANLIWGLHGGDHGGTIAAAHASANVNASPALPSPSSLPKLFLPTRRHPPPARPRRWSNGRDGVAELERPAFERTGTTALIGLSDRRIVDRSRPASMHLAATPHSRSQSFSSNSPSPRSSPSLGSTPPTASERTPSKSNSDVGVIDALMDDERADQVEDLADENKVEDVIVPSSPSKFSFPTYAESDGQLLEHERILLGLGPAAGAEHGIHSGHSNGKGHEAQFPDPCVTGMPHNGLHSPIHDRYGERRRFVPSAAPPLSTVPSSDGTDGGQD